MLYRDLKNGHLIYKYSTSAADVYACCHHSNYYGTIDDTLLYHYGEVRAPKLDEFYINGGYNQRGFNYCDSHSYHSDFPILYRTIQDHIEAVAIEAKIDTSAYLEEYIDGII